MKQNSEIGNTQNGTPFSDYNERLKQKSMFPTKIRIRAGEAIDGIQVFYQEENRQEIAMPVHGNPKGGSAHDIILQSDEFITAVETVTAPYWNGNFIVSLTLLTDKGKQYHFGMDVQTANRRGKAERIECEDGSAVLCFYGSTGKAYDARIEENQRPAFLQSIGFYSEKKKQAKVSPEECIQNLDTVFPGIKAAVKSYESSRNINELYEDLYAAIADKSSPIVLSREDQENAVISANMELYDRLINAEGDDIGKELDQLLGQINQALAQGSDKASIQKNIAELGIWAAGAGSEYLHNILPYIDPGQLRPVPYEEFPVGGLPPEASVIIVVGLIIVVTVIAIQQKSAKCQFIVINELDEDITVIGEYCQKGTVTLKPKRIPGIIKNSDNTLLVNIGMFFTEKSSGSLYGSEYGVNFMTSSSGVSFAYAVECPAFNDNNCACGFDVSAKKIAELSDKRCLGDMNAVKGDYEVIIRRKARRGSTAYFIARIRKSPEHTAQVPRENWMDKLSDDLYLGQINLPGSHDAAAIRTGIGHSAWSCHDRTVTEQLKNGIRVMDLRISVAKDKHTGAYTFTTCHGGFGSTFNLNLFQSLRSFLDEVEQFLKTHQREAVILMIKIDNWEVKKCDQAYTELAKLFSSSLYIKSADMPKLKDARGKVFLINRINDNLNLGAPLTIDDCQVKESKAAANRNFPVYVEDLYKASPSKKLQVVKETIHWQPANPGSYIKGIKLNYASAIHAPALGVYILKHLMAYLGTFLANDSGNAKRNRPVWIGWFMMDYEEDTLQTDRYGKLDMTALIIDSNMRNKNGNAYPSFLDKYQAAEVLKPLS